MGHLVLNEIFSRVDAISELVTDNGGEFLNKVMRETLKSLNIKHITNSPN